MEYKELTCICCPLGCTLEATLDGKSVLDVKGNTCNRGVEYAIKECTNPTRIVTSVIEVMNGNISMVSVKTEKDIPKEKIKDCIKAMKDLKVEAPLKIGTIIIKNVADTPINIIATRNVKKI